MEKNVGGMDRIVRLAVGLILVVTGGLQQCVINQALGINTYRT